MQLWRPYLGNPPPQTQLHAAQWQAFLSQPCGTHTSGFSAIAHDYMDRKLDRVKFSAMD